MIFRTFLYCRAGYFLPSLSHTSIGHLNVFWLLEEQVLLSQQPEALIEQIKSEAGFLVTLWGEGAEVFITDVL